MKRVHVFIEGRVQGVFFRAFIKEHADSLNIKGFCRNLLDGRVEAVFEGEVEKIEEILRLCRRGPPGAFVENVEITEEPFKEEYKGFQIRYTYY